MGARHGRLLSETRCESVDVAEIAYDAETVLRDHCHERAYLSVLLDGAYTELRQGSPRYCTPGTVIVHPSGEVHADYFVAGGRCVNFEFAGGLGDSQKELMRAVRATHPSFQSAIAAVLRERDGDAAHETPAGLARVLREFPWVAAVPLTAAAELAGMHPAHFARAFRAHVGLTPGRYRRRERVRAASCLLLDTPASLAEIAHACGFSDQSHLTNVFRETAGVPPKRYRGAFAR
ncbi:MAG: helix-turn-helix transcriptional regulator [Candidatus Eremiobacteraeota bacterium]|nr:helix-turn-helix transcriptional regulator [Candidatus Eremiobacteraeota bacterium]MBV8370633.1 helix-turn-helix transcriptional regulator [Candidatus Eremiobacteraeota bacterium]